ncbi:MAG: DUF4115 domain-containing protein [Rhodobacteraceae bacterium]|nr:DUF4115 domain-containing protein [Paracoccaceae bacterium]
MIGRRLPPSTDEVAKPKGFDDYELRLGDIMRGERATLSKSLLDVQRELKIKASYIAAIENADASAFDTPGFIAGYVRSYARYLGMDPEWAFARFCEEAGFTVSHGLSSAASGPKKPRRTYAEPLADPNASFVPRGESMMSKVEPGAIGSMLVLALVAGGLGFGGWTVLQQVQRVQLAPVETAPATVAEIDPVAGRQMASPALGEAAPALPGTDTLDRIARPQTLEAPVVVARDGPIAAIDPRSVGTLAEPEPEPVVVAAAEPEPEVPVARTIADAAPGVEIFAVRPAWVRVSAADGTVILEKILDAGERFALPATEAPPLLRAGNTGAVYFSVNGETYGPASSENAVVKNLELSAEVLTAAYQVADPEADPELARTVASWAGQGADR